MLILLAFRFHYGLHCPPRLRGAQWNHGPKAFTVAHINSTFGPGREIAPSSREIAPTDAPRPIRAATAPAAAPAAASDPPPKPAPVRPPAQKPIWELFSETRIGWTPHSRPSVSSAAWHFSYFGTPQELRTKFISWGHSATFEPDRATGWAKNGYENAALDPIRIDRCSRLCLEPIAKSCQARNRHRRVTATPRNRPRAHRRRVPTPAA